MIRSLGTLDDLQIFRVCQTLAVLGYLITSLCCETVRACQPHGPVEPPAQVPSKDLSSTATESDYPSTGNGWQPPSMCESPRKPSNLVLR